MRKIVVTGPECSGKTALAHALSKSLAGVYVPEYARSILTLTSNQYEYQDLVQMCQRQLDIERTAEGLNPHWLIADTSTLVYFIWSKYRFGKVDPKIEHAFATNYVDHFLLCKPLDKWEPDGLRDNKGERDELFQWYEQTLIEYKKSFLILENLPMDHRVEEAIRYLRPR